MAKKKAVKKKKAKKKNNEIKGAHVVFHRLLKAGNCSSVQAILLCKRTQDAPTHPGHWGLIGGTRKKNEPPREAALREVGEELEVIDINIKNLVIKKLCNVLIRRESGKCLISYFISSLGFDTEMDMDKLRLKGNGKTKVEGEGLGWFTAEEIHHLVMRPEDRIAVTKFFQKNGV